MIASNHLEVVDKRRAATREYLKRGIGIDAARGMTICQSKRLYSSAHEAKRHVWTDCNGEHWQAGQQKTGGHRVYTALKVE